LKYSFQVYVVSIQRGFDQSRDDQMSSASESISANLIVNDISEIDFSEIKNSQSSISSSFQNKTK
jgi:hypothetical protein